MSRSDDASQMRRNSGLVAAGITLSRLSGLLRDAVLAFFLGANLGADAFRAALRIPNFLQNLLGEGVLSASFIPTYSRLLDEGREQEAGRVAGAVLGLLAVLSGVLVLLGVLLARPLTQLLTPGFVGERLELTVTLVRIMFPGIGLLVVSAWCLGVLNSHRRFFLSYVAPVLWNLGIVSVLVALGASAVLDPAVAAGAGVVFGGALQVLVQLPAVRAVLRGTLRPSLDTRSPGVRRVLAAFGPIVLGRGVVQIAALLDLVVASLLAVGAVAVLGYAQSLYLLPIALFGMSVAAAELPGLSTREQQVGEELTRRLDAGLGRSSFFVLGTTVGFVLLGGPIVEVLYGRGEFDRATTTQVGVVLGVYALGLLAATASRLLQSVLYASDDAKTPAAVAVVRVAVALAVGVPLMLNLDHLVIDLAEPFNLRLSEGASLPTLTPVEQGLRDAADNQLRLGAAGLAAGSAVGAWTELLLLRRHVRRRFAEVRIGGGVLGRLVVAAALAAGVIALGATWLELSPLAEVVLLGAPAGLVYVGVCWWLEVPEARSLFATLRRGR
ncbi:MAG: murein biosynthesis integral membrane protein MurJ [Nitriliruptoraceae bacterium]